MDASSLRLSFAAALVTLLAACSSTPRPSVIANDASEDTTDATDVADSGVADQPSPDVTDASPGDVAPTDATDVSQPPDSAPDAPASDTPDVPMSDVPAPDVPAMDAAPMDAPSTDVTADVSSPTDAADVTDVTDVTDVAPDRPICAGTLCGAACVNVMTDVRNCGACGSDCTALPGVRTDAVTCVAGRCDVTMACMAGRAHCTATASDGCETDVTTTSNCGRCGVACPARVNATAVCTTGTCGLRCATGFGDCDGVEATGCETDTRTTLLHCGGCGMACAPRPNASPRCAAGACAYTCETGFGDCDSNAINGCETDTRVSVTHCGGCGMTCPTVTNGRSTCAAGACGVVCDTGFTLVSGRCEAPAPRLVHPMSTATVSSRRPTLTFRPVTGTDGTRIQVCADRGCTRVEVTLDATTGSVRPSTELAPGVHFWRAQSLRGGAVTGLASAPWEFSVGRLDTPIDSSWGTMPDVNGDGLGDAIVGSQGAEARVFLGSPAGISSTAATVLRPTDGETTFGFAVQSAGDVNGDGYGDVIVGARGSGAAYIYHGGPTGIRTTPDTTLTGMVEASFGAAVTSVGDVDQDGYGDIAVSAPGMPLMAIPGLVFVYRGGPTGIVASSRTVHNPGETVLVFGIVISSGGDVNGDGFEDMLVGAPGYLSTTAGTMYVFYGSATGFTATPSVRYLGAMGGYYGFPVANVGDINADGYADIATALTYFGRVVVYHGGPTGPSPTPNRTLQVLDRADFGRYISSAGDLNADGYGDVVVGADYFSQVHVYYGSPGGIPIADSALLSGATDSAFGRCVTSPGDTNGDGFPDLLVGAPTSRQALVFLSTGARGLAATSSVTLTSTATDFGYALGGL